MARWLFVRHGQSVANAEGWMSGHVDTPLTPAGRAQARRLRRPLASEAVVRAYCSDLSRARDTAEIALSGRDVPLEVHPWLRERSVGDWTNQPRAALKQDGRMQRLLSWTDGAPGGESQRDLARRVLQGLAGLPEVDGTTLVVCHGGVVRVVLGLLDGQSVQQLARLRVPNAQVLAREVEPGRFAALAETLDGDPGGA